LDLGVGPELKAALLKLSAAAGRTGEQQSARQRIHLDARGWGQPSSPGQHLGTVQAAMWQDQKLRVVTRMWFGDQVEQEVDPLGLAAKAGEWHLVARVAGGIRVYRVRNLVRAERIEAGFERPENFDLAAFWEGYVREVEADKGLFSARLRVSPALAKELRWRLGEQSLSALAQGGPADERGWREIELFFDSHEQARDKVLGFGGGAEVLEPQALRRSVEDFAGQILNIYRT